MPLPGDVVELVDTLGLEPSAARRGGSTPSIPTIKIGYKSFIYRLLLIQNLRKTYAKYQNYLFNKIIPTSFCIMDHL